MMALPPAVLIGVVAVLAGVALLIGGPLLWYFGIWSTLTYYGRVWDVRWVHVVGALGVAAALAWLTIPIAVAAVPLSDDLAGGVALVAIALGVVGIAIALGNLGAYRRVRAGAADASAVGDGPAVVAGTATPREDTVRTPLTDTEALFTRCRVTEPRSPPGRSSGSLTAPAGVEHHHETRSVPIEVADVTGRIAVDLGDATVSHWQGDPVESTTVAVDPADLSDRVASVYDRIDRSPRASHYCIERHVAPGTAVTVVGTVVTDGAGQRRFDGDQSLTVYPAPIELVQRALRRRVWLAGLGGAVLVACGGLVL